MSNDDVKKSIDLDQIDCGHPLDRTYQQLGQVTYSFYVDQQPQTQAGMPSNLVPEGISSSPQVNAQSPAAAGFVHPSDERQIAENKISPAAKYAKEMLNRIADSNNASRAPSPAQATDGSLDGAIDRQTGVGFSSRFNFPRSLDALFRRLDVNRDGRLSKSELDAALSDGSFNGDDELLLILLLRHINDIARQSPGGVSGSALSVTYQSIRSYSGWQKYF